MSEQTPAAGHTAGRMVIRFSNEYGGFTLSTGVGFVCEYWPPMPDANGAANASRLCAAWNLVIDLTTEAIESLTPAHILAAMQHKVAGDDGLRLIANERVRQVEKGFDVAHDDGHTDGSIFMAAAWILNDLEGAFCPSSDEPDSTWEERLAAHVRDKYGDDHIRRLAIAGALIAAEIDRLRRLSPAPAPSEEER